MKKLSFLLLLLCFNTHFVHAQLQLISDDFGRSSFYRKGRTTFNDKFYIVTYNSEQEKDEIWVSNGTVEGTNNFAPNFTNSDVYAPTATDSHLFFIEEQPSGNKVLWATIDGDLSTAVKVREGSGAGNRTVSGNRLFFTAVEPNGFSFWTTDGTVTGTVKLFQSVTHIVSVSVENTVYFRNRFGLYKTDGTVAGTNLVKSIDGNFTGLSFNDGFLFNNEFYFTGCDNIHGCELWKTDGTDTGTQLVLEIDSSSSIINNNNNPNSSNAVFSLLENQFLVKTRDKLQLINSAFDLASIETVKDFSFPNETSGRISSDPIPLNDKVLYEIETDKYGTEFWVSDGTSAGTIPLNVWKNAPSSLDYKTEYTKLGNFFYFTANDGIHGRELWRTDGTEAGTELVRDFTPGLAGTDFTSLETVGNQLFIFFKRDYKRQFWVLDTDTYQLPTYEINRNPNEWFINMGTNQPYDGDARNIEMKLDKDDNIFLVGCFRESNYLEFFQDTFRLPLNPLIEEDNKIFISKFDKQGHLQWAKNIGGYGWIDRNAIQIDNDGNLIVAGYFEEEAAFGSNLITTNDDGIFLAKYSTDGDLIGLENLSLSYPAKVAKVEIDNDGNIYIAGDYRVSGFGWTDFPYLIKYDKSGNLQWIKSFTNELDISYDVTDLVIDDNGNPLVLATDGMLRNPDNSWDEYTELFSINATDGSVRWIKQFKSTERNNIRSMTVTKRGDILLAGHYSGTFQLDSFILKSELMSNSRNYKTTGFVAILDKFGKVTHAFKDGERNSYFYQIIPMEGRNFGVIGGIIYGDEEVEQYENWNLGRSKMFFSEYDGLGNLLRRKEWFQRSVYDIQYFNPSAAIDSENYLVISNTHRSQVDTFSNCFTDSDGNKVYLMRTALDDDNFEIFEPDYLLNDIFIGPNPTQGAVFIQVEDENWFNYQLNIFATNGQLLYSINKTDDNYTQEINISHLPKGVLFFQFNNGTNTLLKKVVKY